MKRLVLCCDGTWNSADKEDHGKPCVTNVVEIAFRIAKRDGDTLQILCYDQGVGTGNLLDHLSGGAFGDGLIDNIYDGYRFLIANYEPDDEIFLFGFSRGAFTARSMSGMIRKCGILKRESVEHYREALALYKDGQHPDDPGPRQFREQHSVCGGENIGIKMVGVWDTVGALGIPLRGLRWMTRKEYQFHNTELSGSVKFAFHALSIDEHRAPFAPTLWTAKPKDGQVVEQTWFCGAHSDVGGGYEERGLSDIALRWMIEKAGQAGLAFDQRAVGAHPLHPDCRSTLHNSKTGLYRPTVGIDRMIGVTSSGVQGTANAGTIDPNQSLHESVRQRWDADPTYRPVSLKNYFKLIGDRRAYAP